MVSVGHPMRGVQSSRQMLAGSPPHASSASGSCKVHVCSRRWRCWQLRLRLAAAASEPPGLAQRCPLILVLGCPATSHIPPKAPRPSAAAWHRLVYFCAGRRGGGHLVKGGCSYYPWRASWRTLPAPAPHRRRVPPAAAGKRAHPKRPRGLGNIVTSTTFSSTITAITTALFWGGVIQPQNTPRNCCK